MDKQNRIKILKETILYQGWSTLKQYSIEYIRRDHKKEHQIREIYDSGDGVTVLLVNKAKATIMLIRQFRLPVFLQGHPSGFILESCAGLLDGQNPEQAIIREIEEETGYRIREVIKIFEAFATPGAHKEKIHYYYGFYDENMSVNSGGGLSEEQEDIEIVEFPISDIQRLLDNGDIIDTKTIVLLQWLLLHRSKLGL